MKDSNSLLESGKKMDNGLKPGSIHIEAASLYLNSISIELARRHRVNTQLLRKVQREETLQCIEFKCLANRDPLAFPKDAIKNLQFQ